ncbi:MAG: hypothetical protein HRU31_16330 [Rhodobacteraceae bacterium]|nr:hypothetical protein [Paracoccaceae bacterium]
MDNFGFYHVQGVSLVKVGEISYALFDRGEACVGVFKLGAVLKVGATTLDDGQVTYEIYGNNGNMESVIAIGKS